MSVPQYPKLFRCVFTVKDGKIITDFPWLNGFPASWAFEEGMRYRIDGVAETDEGYRIVEIETLGRVDSDGPDQKKV